jgi:hypothetical protein
MLKALIGASRKKRKLLMMMMERANSNDRWKKNKETWAYRLL